MHIAFIASQDCVHVCRWANSLIERGHQITLFTLHSPKHSISDSVNIVKLPIPDPLGYILDLPILIKELKNLNPDLVHSFYAFGYGFMARMVGYKPTVLSVMGSEIFHRAQQNKIFKRVIKNNLFNATQVCSTSEVMTDKIKEVCGKNLDVKVTPFGVDTIKFRSPSRYQIDLNSDFVVGTVKWLESKYAVDILIRAFAIFCGKYSEKNFKLILVGGGSKERELKKLARNLNVYEFCEFVGTVDHDMVPTYLKKMDVYVAVSRFDSESFGVAVLEASAYGLPVIVSDAGGLPEVVKHVETGIVVPKENVEATAEALIKLYENKDFASSLGENGRKRVQSKYEWNHSVDIMEDIYRKVTQQ